MHFPRRYACALTAQLALAITLAGCGGAAVVTTAQVTAPVISDLIPNLQQFPTPTGTVATFNNAGSIDPHGIFFQPLGANQRSCATCHQLGQGMSITASAAQALFASTQGTDSLFTSVDGANCPSVAVGDAPGHSLILNFGLIRVGEVLPAQSQFQVSAASDPFGCALAADAATGRPTVSVYRRPLPATSLTFLSDVMWDTRGTLATLDDPQTFAANRASDLAAQAANAIATHEQGTALLTSAQLAQLVTFETGLYTASATDNLAGNLNTAGVSGGAATLSAQSYTPGVNDPGGSILPGVGFSPIVFTLFQTWRNSTNPQQASIARGEDIFNNAPMQISNVGGLNDIPGAPPVLLGSCSTCHDAPNLGSRSQSLPMDTGTSHVASAENIPEVLAGLRQLTAPNLPDYQVTGCSSSPIVTTDPGRALSTGLCADVNRVKVPLLRGLAARAPYFHNGSAATLAQLVNFYDARFRMGLNPQQRQDLANFLNAL